MFKDCQVYPFALLISFISPPWSWHLVLVLVLACPGIVRILALKHQHCQQFIEVLQAWLLTSSCLNWGSCRKKWKSLSDMIWPHHAHPCHLVLHEVCWKTTEMPQLAQFCLYHKMSENRVPLKLKNNATSLSGIFWSELNWATYGVFVETGTACTMLGTIVNK